MGGAVCAVQTEVQIIDGINAVFLRNLVDVADDRRGVAAPAAAQKQKVISFLPEEVNRFFQRQRAENGIRILEIGIIAVVIGLLEVLGFCGGCQRRIGPGGQCQREQKHKNGENRQ